MGLDLEYNDGQTPLDEDEKQDLRIPTIATREELDEFEQLNVEEAMQWVMSKNFRAEIIFTEKFIRSLHKRMFGKIWKWAGSFRVTNKNLGVDKWQIPVAVKNLCDDVMYWHKNEIYTPDELSLRFKHRIVSIHCFPNGNGRHSRLMADIIITNVYGRSAFSWGTKTLISSSDYRDAYIQAVRLADNGNYDLLLEFARS